MKHFAGCGVAMGLLSIMVTPAMAQESEIAQLRNTISDLMKRLEKLEGEQKKTSEAVSKSAPTLSTGSKLPVTVSGLLQVQGSTFLRENGPTLPVQADGFRLRRGELKVVGRIMPKLTGTLMIDPTKGLRANAVTVPAGGGAVTPTINQSTSLLQELFLSYTISQREKNALHVDAGQYKIPIGYEGDMVSSSALQTINRALMYTIRDPFAGGYGDIRETGAQLRGNSGPLGYQIGVYNGFGERQNDVALDDPKAVIGRITYRPKGVDGLLLGVSGGTGSTRTAAGGTRRSDRKVVNAFAAYKKDKLTLQTEYLRGDANLQGGAPGSLRDVQSYYASAGYMFSRKLEGVARYDRFDAARNANGFDLNDVTLGLNYYLKGNNAKIQTNIVRRSGVGTTAVVAPNSGAGIGGLRNDSTALVTQVQVAF